jgi:hypothetical protein
VRPTSSRTVEADNDAGSIHPEHRLGAVFNANPDARSGGDTDRTNSCDVAGGPALDRWRTRRTAPA